jgi:hypothetical protein
VVGDETETDGDPDPMARTGWVSVADPSPERTKHLENLTKRIVAGEYR